VTVSIVDIDKWQSSAVRDVFHAAQARAQVSQNASYNLGALAVFKSWDGETAEAAKAAIASTSKDLEADANEATVVARAAAKAADDIDGIKLRLQLLRDKAQSMGMKVNNSTDTVSPLAGNKMTPMEIELKQFQLQHELDGIVTDANAVDAELADAIELADGTTTAPLAPGMAPPPGIDASEPPPDSLKGGGYWSLDGQKGYDSPAAGPNPPWQQQLDPKTNDRLNGATSGMQDVVSPNWPGAGAEPAAVLQEAYRVRITGESFNGAADHVRWVQQADGKWYQAKWIDYQFEAEHVQQLKPTGDIEALNPGPWGQNSWKPISIQDIYGAAHRNSRLTMYLPDICGSPTVIGQGALPVIPGVPVMRAPR
jgi:hypothetical protein